MDDILKGLNQAQRAAVSSTASVLQVLAPPGSGKTKTLTARVAYLISNHKLKPYNIIVCTFTVKAANEMKERIRAFIGDGLAKDLKLGTFHSIALRYLRHYGQHIGVPQDFGVADSSDSKAILKRIIKKLNLGSSLEPGQILGRISKHKVKGLSNESKSSTKNVAQQEFDMIFAEYEATLAASNLLDYDDLLVRCGLLLRTYPACVSNVQAVLIDEFQDTNTIQYDLMGLFSQQHNTITIVGDPDQSIYGFRMAEVQNLTRMKSQWPDTLTINLKENYRSSGAILHAAQKLIEQDESRPPKKLQATHSFGHRPVLRKLPSASAEAEWLASEIKRTRSLTGNMLQLNDYAILLRSAALSRVIETALSNAGIAYRMVGGIRFYDRFEIKLIVDYLRVVHQPENSEALERIINVPPRRIGEETTKKLRTEAQTRGQPLWKLVLDIAQGNVAARTKITEPTLKGLRSFVNVILSGRDLVDKWNNDQTTVSVEGLITLVTKKITLETYLKSKFIEEESFEARWANVEELLTQAREAADPGKVAAIIETDALPIIEGVEQRPTSLHDLLSLFLANIALTASAEQKAEESGEKAQQVTISTIHAAKGLEWPVVFIPACYEGSIPHSRADDNDEERRLLYVGMTRAQALLYLSCPVKNTQREETTISVFLQQPGITAFFEEHGPSIPAQTVAGLAMTLNRDAPKPERLTQLRAEIERDEDNYWPLNGEEPLEEKLKWNHSRTTSAWPAFSSAKETHWHTTTMQQQQNFSSASNLMRLGPQSVTDRYNELLENGRLNKVDKRANNPSKREDAPRGRKRQIPGQGTLMSSFAKRRISPSEATDESRNQNPGGAVNEPLHDISNIAQQPSSYTNTFARSKASIPAGRICTKPMQRKPITQKDDRLDENNDRYIFLSSSPPPPEIEDRGGGPEPEACVQTSEKTQMSSIVRPASTFHTTSMGQMGTQRRTLGIRRSLHGWSARERK